MTKLGNYLLIIKAYILDENFEEAKRLWSDYKIKTPFLRTLYERHEEKAILEIIALSDIGSLANILQSRKAFVQEAQKLMRSDWHVSILEYLEDVKSTTLPLPISDFIELRHIEVPLSIFSEYRAWRERTIYKVLNPKNEIEVFTTYHSLISTKPGVYFLVGFSKNTPAYRAIYQEPIYQNILKEAGKNYISGGLSGLSTEIYKKLVC